MRNSEQEENQSNRSEGQAANEQAANVPPANAQRSNMQPANVLPANVLHYSDAGLGVFSAIAIIILCWSFFWFKNYNPFQPSHHINVIFKEVANLNDNAAVYIDGMRVGLIEKMELLNKDKVLVRLRITPAKIVVPSNAKFEILTNGVVGAKYIEILLPDSTAHLPDGQIAPLPDNATVMGEDPVRPELALNKLAITLSDIDMKEVGRTIAQERKRFALAADRLTVLANRTIPVMDRTVPVLDSAGPLAQDMRVLSHELTATTRRVNRFMNDPNFSGNLKETMASAKETVEKIRLVAQQINETLSDKPLRTDLLTALNNLSESTSNIRDSLKSVEEMAGDLGLRTDVKVILTKAKDTLQKVDDIVGKPSFGNDLKLTLQESREALGRVNIVAQQVNQILDKKRPLLKLMFGRPGHLDRVQTAERKVKQEKKARTEFKGESQNLQKLHELQDQHLELEQEPSKITKDSNADKTPELTKDESPSDSKREHAEKTSPEPTY